MSISRGIARLAEDTVHDVRDAAREICRAGAETVAGLVGGDPAAIIRSTGHTVAASASFISPGRLISFATEVTDSSLLAEFSEILYGRCDDKIKKADMDLALGLLMMLQKLSPSPFPEMTEDQVAASDSKFAEFKHWMAHAMAAYGRSLLIHPGSHFAGCNDDFDWIAHTTGVDRADIIEYEDAEKVKSKEWLEYYLAVDKAKSAVVLSIRGTLSIKSAMIDLRCDYITQGEYKYHRGIFEASKALVEHIKDEITSALEKNPGFILVTCGHSLGGGAAALVAHLLSSKNADGQFVTKSEGRAIHCYAIEPAASMCARASENYRGLISTLVHKNDIVPALSDGVIEDIKAYAGYLRDHRDYLGRVTLSIAQMAIDLGDSKEAEEYLAAFRSLAKNEKLVPPGMVYFMGKKKRLYFGRVLDDSVANFFAKARFVLGMMIHHFPLNIMKTMEEFK